MTSAAEENYAPAQEAIRNIQSGLNAQIFTGLCDLFYYAANIIDERAEEIHDATDQPSQAGICSNIFYTVRTQANLRCFRSSLRNKLPRLL